jgi:hypothetical protein
MNAPAGASATRRWDKLQALLLVQAGAMEVSEQVVYDLIDFLNERLSVEDLARITGHKETVISQTLALIEEFRSKYHLFSAYRPK